MAAEIPQTTAPSRLRRTLAAARDALIFIAAIAGTSSLLTALTPFPDVGNITRKYHHIRERGGDTSLIYVGSSRVNHEFIPERFDAELARRGHPVESFNFGQDGMWPPESLYMARKILALKPPKLRWMLIDVMRIHAELDSNAATKRGLYWHDLPHMWMAWRQIIEVGETGINTPAEKLQACLEHAALFGKRGTALGEGQNRLQVLLGLQRIKKIDPVADGGYVPADHGPLHGAEREEFLSAVENLRRNPTPKPIDAPLRDAMESIAAEVRAAGVEPVFVVASTIYSAFRFSDWPPAGITVLAFDDPVKYPELYNPDQRHDPHHLDPAGSEAFTRLLAERFAEYLEGRR